MKKMEDKVFLFSNIFIKNFGDKLDEDGLKALFEKYGVVKSVAVVKDRDGNSRGFGFVDFEKYDDAQKAVDALNNTRLEGTDDTLYMSLVQNKMEFQAELHDQQEQQKRECISPFQGVNVYVMNLDADVTVDELREAFSSYGTITSTKIMSDGERSRGFGFVCFSSPEEANKAITEMNGRIVGSKPLYVALAQRREDRKAYLRAQYMQRMTSSKECQVTTVSQTMGKPFQTSSAPGSYFMPFQGQRTYMPSEYVRTTPRWQQQMTQPQFQMGKMCNAWPRGPGGTAKELMTTSAGARSIYPIPTPPKKQPFKYNSSVRNPFMTIIRPQSDQLQPQTQNKQQSAVHVEEEEPLTASMLVAAQPQEQKQMLEDRLYPLIEQHHPDLASKITGVVLEINNSELLLMRD